MQTAGDLILRRAGALGLAALTVWREARSESYACKLAVAYVIATRAQQGRWGGVTILDVISAPKQFTSMTYPGDPQLTRFPTEGPAWRDCLEATAAALFMAEPNPMPGADTYHDTSIATPAAWAKKTRLGQIDRIIFFKTDFKTEETS